MFTGNPTADQSVDLVWGSQIGTYEWRPDADRVRWSPELMRLYGVQKAPATEQEFGALLHPEDRVRVEAETSAYLGSDAQTYSHTFRIVRADGAVRVILDRGAIERDSAGRITLIRGVNIDITDEAHLNYSVERQLRASEMRYRKLFDAIDEGFCVVEVYLDAPDGRIDYRVVEANPAFFAKTGFQKDILGAWLRAAAPGLEEHWFQTYGDVARTGQPIRFENNSPMLGRWYDVYAFPADDPGDHLVAILFNDITDRKRQEEETRLLVEEISHRSKNTLGIVQAIARHTASSGADDFLDRFGARVRALATMYDLLVKNDWRTVSLVDLLQTQLAPFADPSGPRVTMAGPPLSLTDVATKALGMAFHELATNSAKYGALSTASGRICVSWTVEEAAGVDARFALAWLESGGPAVARPTRQGFGTTVTTRMVEDSTRGTVSTDYAPEGLAWRLTCPVEDVLVSARS